MNNKKIYPNLLPPLQIQADDITLWLSFLPKTPIVKLVVCPVKNNHKTITTQSHSAPILLKPPTCHSCVQSLNASSHVATTIFCFQLTFKSHNHFIHAINKSSSLIPQIIILYASLSTFLFNLKYKSVIPTKRVRYRRLHTPPLSL